MHARICDGGRSAVGEARRDAGVNEGAVFCTLLVVKQRSMDKRGGLRADDKRNDAHRQHAPLQPTVHEDADISLQSPLQGLAAGLPHFKAVKTDRFFLG